MPHHPNLPSWIPSFLVYFILRLHHWRVARTRRRLYRWGYSSLPKESLSGVLDELSDLEEYVVKSGHFNTVSRRQPRSVHRVHRTLGRASRNLALGSALWIPS